MEPEETRQEIYARRFGKNFKQYLWALGCVKRGEKPLIVGPEFVVMSVEHYNELQKLAYPTKIEFRSSSQRGTKAKLEGE